MTMLNRKFFTNDISPLLKLATPLVLTGIIESASPFFGTIFLADLGHKELAAGALVRGLFFTLMVVMWGTLNSVSVLVAQKYGEKDDAAISHILRDGVILALIFSPPAFFLLWYVAPIFSLFGQDQEVVSLAQSYLRAIAWGMVPDFLTLVLLQFLTGIGHTRTCMVFMLAWVPLAIFFNYIFIFGLFGLPKFGIAGIGWGLTLSYYITVIALLVYLMRNKSYKQYMFSALSLEPMKYLKELLQVGIPLGAMYCLEVGFFLALILMMGLVGEIQLAATQITMQYLGMLTTVVFSIAQAMTVRMGHKLGEKDIVAVNHTNTAGIFLSVTFMLLVAVCYLFLPDMLIGIDLDITDLKNQTIIKYSTEFLAICALFQLFEAARISLFGSLRALKDTRYTLITSFISFWIIALPLGYLLSRIGLQGAGLWWGMVVGAAYSVILLNRRYQKRIKHLTITMGTS